MRICRALAWLAVCGGASSMACTYAAETTPAAVAPSVAAPSVAAPAAAATKTSTKLSVDDRLPDYKPGPAVEGRLKSVGSESMNNLITYWSQHFKEYYRGVEVESEGKGSGTAIPALTEGTTDVGPMSRDVNSKEAADFKAKFGYEPTPVKTAIDMLAVYVHKDNPIEGLTLEQVDAIFSQNRKRGGEEIRTWGDLGLKGDWASRPISLYGRDPASGTYTYFKEHVLEKGDYQATVKQLPGSSAVVQGVAGDVAGIGYSGIGYKTADVRAVPLAKTAKGKMIPAEPKFAYDGTYPLSRFLYLTVNYKPNSSLSPTLAEFLKFVLSKEGQADVIKAGFLPLPAKVAESARKTVGLAP